MKQTFRPLDIGTLRPFAKGGTGECYRLDEDTILKLYYEGFPEESVLREKDGARAALVAGVPTAISFDLVQVGARQGVVYELVQGKTLSELVVEKPDQAGALGGVFAQIARTLHGAEVRSAGLPHPTEHIRAELAKVDYAPERTLRRITDFLDALDRETRYVHGDFQTNNVIMTRDEPMLIDMGGFSVGSPMIDVATLRFSLLDSPDAQTGRRSPFNGLSREEALAFWQGFAQTYFGGAMEARSAALLRRVTVLKKLWFERLLGAQLPGPYCEAVRREVLETFGDVQAE